MDLNVQLLEGAEALACVHDHAFVEKWRGLAERDPRVTVFQQPEFVLAWYDSAKHDVPVVVLGRSGGRLVGFLALSRPVGTTRVRHAGAHQAVYDGWIAEPEYSQPFMTRALELVFERIRPRRWCWRYVPSGTEIGWATRRGEGTAPVASHVSTYHAPVWDLTDEQFFARKARSKRLRNYVNRFRKEGELTLERVTDPELAVALVTQLVDWVDFRQGALHSTLPFRDDETKLGFYRRLSRHPSARVSLLRVGRRPVAIQIDAQDHTGVTLCLHGYDPREGQRSPGKILLALLAEQLRREGTTHIDLTPSERSWKDDYGSRIVHGYRVEFYRSALDARLYRTRDAVTRAAAALLRKCGADPGAIRTIGTRIRASLLDLPRVIGAGLSRGSTQEVYEIDLTRVENDPSTPASLDLILSCRERRETIRRVLWDALKRFEQGGEPFAVRSNDTLGSLAWLHCGSANRSCRVPGVPAAWPFGRPRDIEAPADVATVVVSYEHPTTIHPERSALSAALSAAAARGAKRVWIVVGRSHKQSRLALRGMSQRVR